MEEKAKKIEMEELPLGERFSAERDPQKLLQKERTRYGIITHVQELSIGHQKYSEESFVLFCPSGPNAETPYRVRIGAFMDAKQILSSLNEQETYTVPCQSRTMPKGDPLFAKKQSQRPPRKKSVEDRLIGYFNRLFQANSEKKNICWQA